MRRIIYIVMKAVMGLSFSEDKDLYSDIHTDNFRDLEYISNVNDKRNIKGDIRKLRGDFDKAKKQAEVEFNINL